MLAVSAEAVPIGPPLYKHSLQVLVCVPSHLLALGCALLGGSLWGETALPPRVRSQLGLLMLGLAGWAWVSRNHTGSQLFLLSVLVWTTALSIWFLKRRSLESGMPPSITGRVVRTVLAGGLALALGMSNLDALVFVDANHCAAKQRLLGAALRHYASQHDTRYPERLELLEKSSLRHIPSCVELHSDSARLLYHVLQGLDPGPYVYTPSRNRKHYTLHCPGDLHKGCGLRAGSPGLTSEGKEDTGVPPNEILQAYEAAADVGSP